jgi:hypothetical protein
MKYPSLIFLLLYFFAFVSASAQTVCSPKDRQFIAELLAKPSLTQLADKPMGDIIVEVGKEFLGRKYVAFMLDKSDEEQLVINLSELDCTTFVENVVVLARLVKMNETTFDAYERELTLLRYRDGKINDYPSRLHYASDWIYTNEAKGILSDRTQEVGGLPLNKTINFMSSNTKLYPRLANSSNYVSLIKTIENSLNAKELCYVSKERIPEVDQNIQHGDIMAITTTVNGLDISHIGFAYKEGDTLKFLHASQSLKKVVISDEPFYDYTKGIKSQSGIMVARVLPPS